MKNKIILVIFCLLIGSPAYAIDLFSKDIQNNKPMAKIHIYNNYGCHGDNVVPQLMWMNAPIKTKSYAITVYDLDAPNGGWWHWLAFNIPNTTTSLAQNAKLPKGSIESITSFGTIGYSGACPPRGNQPHRYEFTLYALDVAKLNTDKNDGPDKVSAEITKHTLDKVTLTPLYGRQ